MEKRELCECAAVCSESLKNGGEPLCRRQENAGWVSVEEKLPKLSYNESYESYPVLVYSPEEPGIINVADLVEDKFGFGDYSWELYIPGRAIQITVDFETFNHWMPLPEPPLPKCDKDKQ